MADGIHTFAGTKLAVTSAQPASGLNGATVAEYEALTFTEDDCTLESSPQISRSYNAVSSNLVCKTTNVDRKGSAKWDAVNVSFEADTGNQVQLIVAAAEPTSDILSFRITYPNGNMIFFQAVVGKFTVSDGGGADDTNKRSLELWLQMDDVVSKLS